MAKRAVDFSNLPGDTRWTDPQLAEQLARQERIAAQKAYVQGSRDPATWGGQPPPAQPTPPAAVPGAPAPVMDPSFWEQWRKGQAT